MTSLEIGQRVVRSNTWSWSNQDGGEGHVGTVVRLGNDDPSRGKGTPSGWVKIRWDNGNSNNYQVGAKNSFDLLLLDNAPAGVTHFGVTCDACLEECIAGMRWKCTAESCPDYDLCTSCYMNEKHDVTHTFTRIASNHETRCEVCPRFEESKTISRGLFPGATVRRGKDWQGGEDDGEGEGVIEEVCGMLDRPRSAATVRWSETGIVKKHRVGYDGKMDLTCVKAGVGLSYYSHHLPILGKEDGIRIGDHVSVTLDTEMLKVIHGTGDREWQDGMGQVFAKIARVTGITRRGDVEVKYANGDKFVFHPHVLNKLPKLGKGDRVQVNTDLAQVMSLQKNSRNGWVDGMEACIGKEGDVTHVDEQMDVRVKLPGILNVLSWHPCSLTLVKKNSATKDDSTSGQDLTEKLMNALMSMMKRATGSGSSDETEDGDEGKELVEAAKSGKVERVVEILSKCPEKANSKKGGKSALHKASAHGNMEVVQALVEAGADLEIVDSSGNTPLLFAVEGDEPAIVKYLIQKGADVNRGNKNGRRALHSAAWKGHVDCGRVLIRNGCNVNLQDSDGDTALHDAVNKKSTEIIEFLLAVPEIDLTVTNKRGLTPLQFTAFLDRPSEAAMIVQAHPRSIVIPREDGHTVLHIAAVNNHVDVLKVILDVEDHGLYLDSKNDIGLSALHLACTKGQTESIEFLVNKGADINCPGKDDNTPLHLVAMAKAKDDTRVNDTPILRKIRKRFKQCGCNDSGAALMCFMVQHGASVTIENQQCRTPLSYVINMALKKTLKLIASGDSDDIIDMSSWEDLGDDEDVKTGQLSGRMEEEMEDGKKGHVDRRHSDDKKTNRTSGSATSSTANVFDLVHQIEVSELKMGEVVGKGQFGVVYRATWRGTPVAVKKLSTMGSRHSEVEKEVAIHRRANHPNIVQIMALGYDGPHDAYMVMQLIEGRSLYDIIFPSGKGDKMTLSRQEKLQISRPILQAITYMHACSILHLDIKPANILIETLTNRPYLCDLGLAHIKSRHQMSQSSVNMRGTPCYMPPEALDTHSGRRHTDKHDVWSVAGTLVELFAEKQLWGDAINMWAFFAQMLTGAMGKPNSLALLDEPLRKILEQCFNHDPKKRPSAHELLDKFNAID